MNCNKTIGRSDDHFNSLNGQLAGLRKENSLLRTEIQKLTDKLSQNELPAG
jgi:regulator of replication initiation timing